jgi:hypothetical protein
MSPEELELYRRLFYIGMGILIVIVGYIIYHWKLYDEWK